MNWNEKHFMSKNVGKNFEENWKKSIPKYIWNYRPPDQAQSFNSNKDESKLRFSAKSPCDCFIFDGNMLYTLELKTVGTNSISFERTKNDKGIIHKHQIDKLLEFSAYKNIISGLILDFRLSEKTYFCEINEFIDMINNLNKKSFNEKDLYELCNPIEIEKKKLKINWKYNVEKFLNATKELKRNVLI